MPTEVELQRHQRSAPGPPLRAQSVTPQSSRPSRSAHILLYAALVGAVLLIHGYHPFAEDGGLYVAGVEYLLHPASFPHFTAFVTAHLHVSLFAPLLAFALRTLRLPLEAGLLLGYLLGATLMFFAADRLLRRSVAPAGRLGGLLLLAIWWTLPVAGTSLFLEDPNLTARSASTPLTLLAISLALGLLPATSARTDGAAQFRAGVGCVGCLLLAVGLHPLMAGYGIALLLCIVAVQSRHAARTSLLTGAAALGLAAVVQGLSRPESSASCTADLTRYYWFPAAWHWFELLGLAGPLVVLYALNRWGGRYVTTAGKALCRGSLLCGAISGTVAFLFAHAGFRSHAVARLQPLRAFLLIYVVMVLLLGSAAAGGALTLLARSRLPALRWLAALPLLGLALLMFSVQRLQFAYSPHLELPFRDDSPNPWVQAFLWVRSHTPEDALFALDATYISLPQEDAQSFRAIARRSAPPDYSKDGGIAAIAPALAPAWQTGVTLQTRLSRISDAERAARLRPLGVTWIILQSESKTGFPCPYRNRAVKVCRIAGSGTSQ